MRFGAVGPKLLQVYRDGDLTWDQLMAFAITDDPFGPFFCTIGGAFVGVSAPMRLVTPTTTGS